MKTKNRFAILTAKTEDAKIRLSYHGNKWYVRKIVNNLKYSKNGGPFLLLRSRDGSTVMYVSEKEDNLFDIRIID